LSSPEDAMHIYKIMQVTLLYFNMYVNKNFPTINKILHKLTCSGHNTCVVQYSGTKYMIRLFFHEVLQKSPVSDPQKSKSRTL